MPDLEPGPLRACLEDLLRGPEVAPTSAGAPLRVSLRRTRAWLDGARVPGPSEGRVPDTRCGRCRPDRLRTPCSRTPTTFPSSASRGHPSVAGATARRGGDPLRTRRTGRDLRSTAAPRRATASWRPGCLPPSRARAVPRISPGRTRAGLLLAPPTRSPQDVEKCRWSGIARRERAGTSPDRPRFSESEHLWKPAVIVPFGSDSRTWD